MNKSVQLMTRAMWLAALALLRQARIILPIVYRSAANLHRKICAAVLYLRCPERVEWSILPNQTSASMRAFYERPLVQHQLKSACGFPSSSGHVSQFISCNGTSYQYMAMVGSVHVLQDVKPGGMPYKAVETTQRAPHQPPSLRRAHADKSL